MPVALSRRRVAVTAVSTKVMEVVSTAKRKPDVTGTKVISLKTVLQKKLAGDKVTGTKVLSLKTVLQKKLAGDKISAPNSAKKAALLNILKKRSKASSSDCSCSDCSCSDCSCSDCSCSDCSCSDCSCSDCSCSDCN